MYVCMYVCMMCVCVYVCMYVCMYVITIQRDRLTEQLKITNHRTKKQSTTFGETCENLGLKRSRGQQW